MLKLAFSKCPHDLKPHAGSQQTSPPTSGFLLATLLGFLLSLKSKMVKIINLLTSKLNEVTSPLLPAPSSPRMVRNITPKLM